MSTAAAPLIRREYLARGVVQGVGFRPHVATVAARFAVTGKVGNDPAQVFIELQGLLATVEACAAEIFSSLPPLATVIAKTVRELPVVAAETSFQIVASRSAPGIRTLIPPDVAPCAACLAELRDPQDRRFGHPFISCTDCGPRVSIICDLPYDRPLTTMRDFPLCPACAGEYSDPADRRFHAQPISCFDCGPALWLVAAEQADASHAVRPASTTGSQAEQADVIAAAIAALAAGKILAVKGVGGFHLVCDATNEAVVAELRARKQREGKPFAVLVADLAQAQDLVHLSPATKSLLASPQRPIVISGSVGKLAPSVAPGLADLGVMLPSSPLYELLAASGLKLVATSANIAGEPLIHRNAEAISRLSTLADQFLLHDRDIALPVEDSVLLEADPAPIVVRRSRGHAPLPVPLPATSATVLAVGGELKNTCTLAHGDLAFLSAHVGDMGSLATQQAFDATVRQLLSIHRSQPELLVCDLHPGYATTSWAERYAASHGLELLRVQHHLAHALTLMAEHGITAGPVVVATFDGTGYGTDGSIWGGEILTLGSRSDPSPLNWQRAWQVPNFALVGGDKAIRHPWRIAQGLAHSWELAAEITGPKAEKELVASQLANGFGVVQTSSLGRLFDAASALLGICQQTSYEAQAAMELECAATSWTPTRLPPAAGSLREIFIDLLAHPATSVAERAWVFHQQLAQLTADVLAGIARQQRTSIVGLTGGVAMNRLFSKLFAARIAEHGLELLTHRVLPPNDGSLSLGQAWAGRLSKSAAADPPPACPPSASPQRQ